MYKVLYLPCKETEKSHFICDNQNLNIDYGTDLNRGQKTDALFAFDNSMEMKIVMESEKKLYKPTPKENYDEILLQQAKNKKYLESDEKCNQKRYSQTFMVTLQEQECEFDTTEKTQSDLQAAGLVTLTGVTYDNWVTNNGVTINLTAEDIQLIFPKFFSLVSPLYNIQLYYKGLIDNASTVEEVEAIEINYDINLEGE